MRKTQRTWRNLGELSGKKKELNRNEHKEVAKNAMKKTQRT
jgi:hypothetical protein